MNEAQSLAEHFDYVIAGAGAAGLSLAYHLLAAGFKDKRILLIDREIKTRNDRTWCFWETGEGAFEKIVFRRWDHIWFFGNNGLVKCFDILPYQYKMIRGQDFYEFMNAWLALQKNIVRITGEIEGFESNDKFAAVVVNQKKYSADWIFNSAIQSSAVKNDAVHKTTNDLDSTIKKPGYHKLWQHFKGWLIRSPEAVFDPKAATFMDFRVAQSKTETQFVYVLPHDPHVAMIEYTVFSENPWEETQYDAGLKKYLQEFLKLNDFEILETEIGAIPMTDVSLPRLFGLRIMNIGIAGGRAKASTGYTFARIQKQSSVIAKNLRTQNTPLYSQTLFDRHAFMDSVLLHVLEKGEQQGADFFSQLFAKNAAPDVLRFLDEASNLGQDLKLMASVDIRVFMQAVISLLRERCIKI